jgi:dynactin complex subunit
LICTFNTTKDQPNLVQSQAALMQHQTALMQNQRALVGDMRQIVADIREIDSEIAALRRQSDERFVRIETILLEHSRILEGLPDAISERMEFHPPERTPIRSDMRCQAESAK